MQIFGIFDDFRFPESAKIRAFWLILRIPESAKLQIFVIFDPNKGLLEHPRLSHS